MWCIGLNTESQEIKMKVILFVGLALAAVAGFPAQSFAGMNCTTYNGKTICCSTFGGFTNCW